ncbi:vesicle-fusing ATPase 1 [Trichonephila clavata]|uniref:Vesicle-fusing ATPase n=1 Tax=Trichonephila clavata TaxID=2740835 RepID=A0A8X6FX72_TRICU|nr:vesicle-fusing ATPase 1 [Trichonephila clavata]
MAVQVLSVAKCPTENLSFTNCAIVNEKDFPLDKVRHVEVTTSTNRKYVFTLKGCPGFPCGQIGFSLPMRKWAELSLNQTLEVRPYTFNPNIQYIAKVVLEVDFLDKKTTLEPYDTEKMATEFVKNFCKQAFTVGQMLAFSFQEMKILKLIVKEMEAANIEQVTGNGKPCEKRTTQIGLLLPDAVVVFEKAEGSAVNLVGKAKGKTAGSLSLILIGTFRRWELEQLGLKHVRGILLFGPPGTGKTLMARQIGQMLNAREPKIVNGPQILDKYVGESEANIRRLFAEAEEEEKRLGPKVDFTL